MSTQSSRAVLTYAGDLTVTVVTDPDATPDADVLVAAVEAGLTWLGAAPPRLGATS